MLWVSEHGGTHMDAPSHVDPGGKTVDQVSLERLMGTAVVIDLSLSAHLDPDTQLQIPDITGWEAWNGQIQDNSILAVNTGWGRYWPNATRILGTPNHSDPSAFHYPGVHPNAASWLVENRPQVVAIAVDTPSVDFGQNKNYSVHRIFAKAGVPVFQNVANLDQLPPSGCKILAIPMKIEGGSGAPLRIFAILHEHREKQRDHFHLTTDLRYCHSASADISAGSQFLPDKRCLSVAVSICFFIFTQGLITCMGVN
ncbi:isatin hydrolase-like [Liolophura sinensis]|uniref:isatin hydrolase-like n=1 Tax=Liolophura sinensis TaxID=3198878 RepID=UPI00315937B1